MYKKIEIYDRPDGFMAGRELKNGAMSADAHRITGEEIITMFTRTFSEYCHRHRTDKMLIQDAEGDVYIINKAKTKVVDSATRIQ